MNFLNQSNKINLSQNWHENCIYPSIYDLLILFQWHVQMVWKHFFAYEQNVTGKVRQLGIKYNISPPHSVPFPGA